MVVFFKQKTAYEMRISDWSSDVCSSDLWRAHHRGHGQARLRLAPVPWLHMWVDRPELQLSTRTEGRSGRRHAPTLSVEPPVSMTSAGSITSKIGRESGRERLCPAVRISVVGVSLTKQPKKQEQQQ